MKKINRKNKRTRTIKKKYGGKRVKLGVRQSLNKTKKSKNNVTVRCSPKEKNKINQFTCYTDEALYKLRDLWNARHPDEMIHTNNTKEIHSKLTEYLKDVCNKESCWIKQKYDFGDVGDDIADSFAPESPKEWKKNPNEWLSSVDIMKVMKQYEKAYKCFEFLGPTPIDFDTKKMYGTCVWEELCNFSLQDQLRSGKTKIGIVFNTDPHNKPGQHWISMFINIKKKQIFFFDSVGTKAPSQVMDLVNRIKEQGKQMNPKILFTFDENHPVEHQYGNSQCGIYSIFFIVHMLEDKITDHYLKTHLLKDEYIAKFRKVYFNDSL
jgi:Ulp1 family protease